jgi:DNA-directed RNA polymerase
MTQIDDRQIALEQEGIEEGAVRYRNQITKLTQRAMVSTTRHGKRTMAHSITPVSDAVVTFCSAAAKPGRKHTAIKYLSQIEPEVVALLTIKAILDRVSPNLTATSITIGTAIENELRFRHFEATVPALFNRTMENINNNKGIYAQKGTKAGGLRHVMKKFKVEWQEWGIADRLLVGSKMLEIVIESTGWFRIAQATKRKKTMKILEEVPEFATWLEQEKNLGEWLSPVHLPMIAPPIEWTDPGSRGGYLNERLKRPLIKSHYRTFQKEARLADMPEVINAANTLQSTPWQINGPLLTILEEVWQNNVRVKDMPAQEEIPMPAKPGDYETNEESQKHWKYEAAETFRRNRQDRSKRIQVARIKHLANRFAAEPVLYFPTQFDFRGRAYYLPTHLNPQGCDLAKSLLVFANKKPLGERGAYWLAVHVANTFGYDKCSMDERAQWAHEHSEEIQAYANDPVANRGWTDADKPWQFLAACVEWTGYCTDGSTYDTGLPILVDGSCNGIQHFSAMLRDAETGRHVNLTPNAKPGDIYAAVAAACKVKLEAEAEAGNVLAMQWLSFGIDRSLMKRPVMVLPYGGTLSAVKEYLVEAYHKKVRAGSPALWPDRKDKFKAVNYLAKLVWQTMSEAVVGPRQAMDWIKKISRIVAKQGLPIVWTAPTGFMCLQSYPEWKSRLVKTTIGDSVMRLKVREAETKLDSRKQSQAIAPNFVHSLDAAAMALTIAKTRQHGITDWVAIHDSYGTHACDMDVLQRSLREVFVELYETRDVLQGLADEIGKVLPDGETLPPRPAMGSLNIRKVLDSAYFFA